jgi:predicted GIY-YIG superfamily endonuclease
MGTKKVKFNKTGIEKLPNKKHVVYKIESAGGKNNYTGIAQRGRVQERLLEHLGKIPGVKVSIEQIGNIKDAREKEARIIKRSKPKYNEQGK